jgi:hypothetical protein
MRPAERPPDCLRPDIGPVQVDQPSGHRRQQYVGSTCSTAGAAGHFTYIGGAASPGQPSCTSACRGYYSYNLGSWHVVALNTECSQPGVGGCGATSPQGKWLAADLAAHPAQCTLAYWHRPGWNDAGGVSSGSSYFVQALYNAGTESILTGHNHYSEMFNPRCPRGPSISTTASASLSSGPAAGATTG